MADVLRIEGLEAAYGQSQVLNQVIVRVPAGQVVS